MSEGCPVACGQWTCTHQRMPSDPDEAPPLFFRYTEPPVPALPLLDPDEGVVWQITTLEA